MTYSFTPGRRTGHSAVRPSPVFLLIVLITVAGGALAWDADLDSVRAKIGVFVLVVAGWVVSLCLHEFAHAYVAWRAGDHEVEMRGYLTLNPLKYSHPVLSIGLPLVFIALGGIGLPGGAVYLDTSRFSAGVQRLVSAVGPASNGLCAVVLLVVIRMFGSVQEHGAFWLGLSFLAFLQITAFLLNILPVPGLDGYGIIEPSLSYETRRGLDQIKPYGMLILFAVIFFTPLSRVFFDGVYALFGLSGVPDVWAAYGSQLTRFWR
ncbi:putative zinc metalloprotease Rip2 [Nocardia neocaledoniensis NBRC 108232]|uniref:Zn-dependent protease n=1 Tax=Nocardia neocaledoniensis TaxID=236511 RepID=A0A317NM97_9NOCA|nr:site-2 protease family protein [Nocardia neocaledoniensis]PWV75913.1 Zn-dependent protease [Nocardia neocaledoniensis]GEM32731.1 putative zinc metalloprotease Rip2 [Nocardia neocaledoniensis NBRC 108232]